MAITSNDSGAPTPSQDDMKSAFEGTTLGAAPAGGLDFINLLGRVGTPRLDPTVAPYLEAVAEQVQKSLPGAKLIRLPKRNNYHAFQWRGEDGMLSFFGLMFISTSDPTTPNLMPASMRMAGASDELKEMFPDQDIRLVDQRVVIAGYAPEMALVDEMAACIIRTLRIVSDPISKNATISSLKTVEFSPDWNVGQARQLAAQLSPHAVQPRMDLGMTLRAKINSGSGNREFREVETEYVPLGVIGGYVDIREQEEVVIGGIRELRYQPVFNVTVCNSAIPLEGIGLILLACLAPSVYNTHFWLRQWQNLSDGNPNPGMLDPDPTNPSQPTILKDSEDLLDFVRARFMVPQIQFHLQQGGDGIPGMYRAFEQDADQKAHFISRITHFFETEGNISQNDVLSRLVEMRFEGAYGDVSGVLHDSRDIDYLAIAAKSGMGGIDPNMRQILLGVNPDTPQDRALLIQRFTQSFIPTKLTAVHLVNPEFLRWVGAAIESRGLSIVDPSHRQEGRSFSSLTEGFGSGAGMSSPISSGVVRQGLNLGRFMNF